MKSFRITVCPNNKPLPAGARRGVTLTEVLMALMVMSIGVSSVAVLFPLSMVRCIQATQLTNAAILKINVEAILDARPELVFDPDGDGNLIEHFREPANRNYVVDPSGFYSLLADGHVATHVFGNDGSAPYGTLARFGGGLTTLQGAGQSATAAAELQALRILGQQTAGQGDGWTTIVDAAPLSATATTVDLPETVDLRDVPTSSQLVTFVGAVPHIPDPENFRVVFYSANGSFSQAFPLLAVSHPATPSTVRRVYFSENAVDLDNDGAQDAPVDFNGNGVLDIRNLPLAFYVDDTTIPPSVSSTPFVSRVLIQTRRVNDFQWLLTVRRRGDGAARNIDVVVKFSDGVDPVQERIYDATFVRNSNSAGVVAPSAGLPPNIRKGKFIFDAGNAWWYRIQDVQTAPLVPVTSDPFDWSTYTYRVILEEPARASAGSDASNGVIDGDDTSSYGNAMFPVGIVDVYPMGSRPMPFVTN